MVLAQRLIVAMLLNGCDGMITVSRCIAMKSRSLLVHFHFVTFLIVVTIGCGGGAPKDESRAQVSGVVTLDGKPLPAGTLTFKSKNSPKATQISIKADGKYSTDRVPLGVNLVGVETESLRSGSPRLYTPIPAKYTEYMTSGFEVDVKAGVNENVNFDMKP